MQLKQFKFFICIYLMFSSIQFNLFCVHQIHKEGYDPQDMEHVNSVTPLVYNIIYTKQIIK